MRCATAASTIVLTCPSMSQSGDADKLVVEEARVMQADLIVMAFS
jgi:hypothetical protein